MLSLLQRGAGELSDLALPYRLGPPPQRPRAEARDFKLRDAPRS